VNGKHKASTFSARHTISTKKLPSSRSCIRIARSNGRDTILPHHHSTRLQICSLRSHMVGELRRSDNPQKQTCHARVQRRSEAGLQATIDLVHNILRRVCRPVFAGLFHSHWNFHALDIMWPLDEVQVESLGEMPSDAAYESVEASSRSSVRLTGNGRARLQDCCCRIGIPCSQREPDCGCHDAGDLSVTRCQGRCF